MKTITLFRKMALTAGLMLLAFSGWGQILLVEDFDYPIGNLLTNHGWTAHSVPGTQPIDVTNGLSFPGFIGSDIGGAANLDNNGEDVHKTFAQQTSGVVYAAFIIQTQSSNSAGYFLHFGQTTIGTTFFTRVWVNGTGNGVGIGTNAPATYIPILAGVPTLLVAKLDIPTKVSSLFVFNSFPGSEPQIPDATFTETASFSNVGSIALRQYNASQKIIVDGIRIAKTWSEAVVPGTTVPIAAAPTFNPPGGSYYSPQSVVISTSTLGADIYYSLFGDAGPWSYYSEPIGVNMNTSIWAYAVKPEMDPSPISSAVYTFPTIIEVADIASLRAYATAKTSDAYKLTGEAVLTFKTSSRNAKYIQDATGAILIDDNNGKITTSYNLYDGITGITGTLGYYFNMLQFTPVMDPGAATSSNNIVVPETLTLAGLDSTYQAKLVKINGVTISATGNFASGTNYTINDDSKATGVLRTAYTDLNYIGQPIPAVPQDLVAVVLQYQASMQLVPRSLADFSNTAFTVDPPASFAASAISESAIELTFTPNNATDDVVIVHNKTGNFQDPSGPPPSKDSDFAGGTLLYVGTASPQTHSGLNPEETIYYKAWSYDGASYSSGLTANATTNAAEPTNHVTNFTATANSHNSITVAWVDSDAAAYLIKGSNVGFGAITAPADGTPVPDGTLVKNIIASKGNHEFTGLSPETEYFFKIFPYNGSGATINYKTGGEVPQASATTAAAPAVPEIITQWNFNSSNLVPNIGTGIASNIGGTSSAYATGNPGQGWNTSAYPAQGTGSGTAGVRFMVSTVGYEDIVLNFDHRASGTASRWTQVDYTTDGGTTWTAFDNNDGGLTPSDNFYSFEFDFSGIPAANHNPNFGIRIVSIFSPLAFNQNTTLSYGANEAYMRANADAKYAPVPGVGTSNYATTGTWRFDNVTFSGFAFVPDPPVKLVITDVNSGNSPTVDVPFSVTIQAKDANNNPSNVNTDTQVMLILGSGAGILGGTVSGIIPAGQHTLVLSEVTYNTPENDVVIVAMTTGGMGLTMGVSAPFNVISPATHLAFVNFPQSGYINIPVSQFTVEARRPNNTVDPGYTGIVQLSMVSKSVPVGGTVSGTLSVAAVAGLATFNNVFFDDAGTYTLHADAEGLMQATSGAVVIFTEPTISGVLVPKYIVGNAPANDRLPYAFRASLSNLIPNATYKYINQADSIVTGTAGGAGNCIFVVQDGSFYRTTNPGFTNAANHGEFTSDENGSYTGWFILEPTTNVRFTPGKEVFMRIRINDGAGGTTAKHYLTIEDAVKVIGFGTEANLNQGTAVMGLSEATPKNFVFLYDESLELRGRPIAGTSIESVGINFTAISQYAAFYKNDVSGVDGAWGTIIPNINENGVRRIEERSLADGGVIDYVQSFDGIWGETNTVNPNGGTTALVIDLMPPVVPPVLVLHDIIVSPLDPECYAATDSIIVSDFIVNPGINVTLVAGPNGVILLQEGTQVLEGGYLRAWIDIFENYCSLPTAAVAAKNDIAAPVVAEVAEPVSLFRAYPNPTAGIFTLELNQDEAGVPVTMEIYNTMGNRMMQQELSGTNLWSIDLTALPRGMYILRILKDGQAETQRIIKN